MTSQNTMTLSFRKTINFHKDKFRIKARNFSENKEGKLVPGPGAYSPYIDPVAKRDPSFKMPKAERGDVN